MPAPRMPGPGSTPRKMKCPTCGCGLKPTHPGFHHAANAHHHKQLSMKHPPHIAQHHAAMAKHHAALAHHAHAGEGRGLAEEMGAMGGMPE